MQTTTQLIMWCVSNTSYLEPFTAQISTFRGRRSKNNASRLLPRWVGYHECLNSIKLENLRILIVRLTIFKT
jgi:hypothetical protein